MASKESERRNERKAQTPENYPCLKEKNLSMKCLDENNYDYSKCQRAFDNFKFCNKFWDAVQKQRRAANLKPFLPEADEREEIMTHFKKTGTLLDTSQRSV